MHTGLEGIFFFFCPFFFASVRFLCLSSLSLFSSLAPLGLERIFLFLSFFLFFGSFCEKPGQLQGSKTPKPEIPRKKLRNYPPDPDPKSDKGTFTENVVHEPRLLWHTSSDFYGIRTRLLCRMSRFYWGRGWSSIYFRDLGTTPILKKTLSE